MTAATTTLNPGTGGDQMLVDTLTTVDGAGAPASSRAQVLKMAWGAASIANVLSPATPAVQTVKAAAGRIVAITLTNTNAAARFLKVWNTASGSITLGTTAALFEVGIPPNQTLDFSLEGGIGFSTAINIAVTAGQGLTNNAAVTAGDVTGIIAFA